MSSFKFFVTKLGNVVGYCALAGLFCAALGVAASAQRAPGQSTALINAEEPNGPTVMLDAWFNSHKRKNASGQMEYFHYKWNDTGASGYSLLGQIFEGYGAKLDTLYTAPTLENLKDA